MGRAGDDKAVLGSSRGGVVLEDQPRPFPFVVDLAGLGDRGGLGGRPVQAVEPDDEQVLGPLGDGLLLDPVQVALVGVVGFGVDRIFGQEPVECLDFLGSRYRLFSPVTVPSLALLPKT